MPYASDSEVPDYVPEEKRAQWREVWNSAHAKAKSEGKSDKAAEESAFAQANGVAGPHVEEKTMKFIDKTIFPLLPTDDPVFKVDVEKHEVWGTAVLEALDQDKEIFDYESSKPYYQEWSNKIFKASDGKSLGNVREMHARGMAAVGKVIAINFNDARKAVEVGVKIVDDTAWQKIKERVYTGFSHGGRYVRKWPDPTGATRYTAKPFELTLADNPCIPGAYFNVVKADGTTERMEFAKREVSEKERSSLADEGKALPDGSYPIANVEDLKNAIQAIGRAKNPAQARAHIKRRARALGRADLIPDSWKGTETKKLTKSMWEIGRLAEAACCVENIRECLVAEAVYEGDGSPIPEKLQSLLDDLCDILVLLTEEETSELKGAEKSAQNQESEAMTSEEKQQFDKVVSRLDAVEKMSKAHEAHLQAISEHHGAMGSHISAMLGGKEGDGKDGEAEKIARAKAATASASPADPEIAKRLDATEKQYKELVESFGKMVQGIAQVVAGRSGKLNVVARGDGTEGAVSKAADGKAADGTTLAAGSTIDMKKASDPNDHSEEAEAARLAVMANCLKKPMDRIPFGL